MKTKSILLTAVLAITCLFGNAQEQRDLKKEVKVRTNFKPKIKKAKRIGEMPNVIDTLMLKKQFDYSIRRESLNVNFKPGSIKAAKVTRIPLKKVHGHSFDLAAGNYASLFADYRYNNLNSKKSDFGLHLQYFSSKGKLKLENGSKVKPDWNEFLAELYGNHYLNDVKLSSRVFFKHKSFNYYGSPLVTNTTGMQSIFDYDDQKYNNIGIEANYESLNKTTEDLNYKLGVAFEYFTDDNNVSEVEVEVNGLAQLKASDDALWSLESSLNFLQTNNLVYYSLGLQNRDISSSLWLVNPSYNLSLSNFNMRLGVKVQSVLGNDSEFKLYPDVKFNLVLVNQVLDMFAGLDGNLDQNTMRSISDVNPFVYSGLDVKNTSTNYRIYGGIKTRISSKSNALFSIEYANIDDQYFFSMANDAVSSQKELLSQKNYTNKYAVVYDDITKLSLTGEVDFQFSEELNLYTLVKYSHYSLNTLEEAWHMPSLELEAKASYRFTNEWLFNARILFVGERKVMTNAKPANLDVLADFGLGAEYKWSDLLSVYANVNNIFNAKPYLWHEYPSQGINGMIGVKLVF